MCHHDGGEALLLPDPLDQLLHLDPGERVECAERFIQQQQPRMTDQRARQCDALLLTAGQHRWPGVLAPGETDLAQCGRRLRRGALPIGRMREADLNVRGDTLPWQQARLLEHQSHHVAPAGCPLVQRDAARGRRVQSGDQPQQRRFAAAAAADDGNELARLRSSRSMPCSTR